VGIGPDSGTQGSTAGRGGAIASPFEKALAVGLLEDDLAIPVAMARIRGNAAENGAGGAIHSAGTLALHRVHLSNNEAASGGAVHVRRGDPNGRCADLWVFDSHVANNRATRDGGGILLEQGELHVEASTFHANRAGGRGGALHYASSDSAATLPCHFGMASILNTSFDGNIAAEGGGGVYVEAGSARLMNVTIVHNVAEAGVGGGGIGRGDTGTVFVQNSIVADNDAGNGVGHDCAALLQSQGYNLIEDLSGCTVGGETASNLVGIAPGLTGLQLFGDALPMHGLRPDSPAIDAVGEGTQLERETACRGGDQRSLPEDMRRSVRPADPGYFCDIGAFEGGVDLIFADGFD
jgi:predicted outer membrane repeat protein